MPTARFACAGAVVEGILYVIGGNPNGSSQLNVVEAYDPATNEWSTKSPMPTARDSISAAVQDGIIYVVGGYNNSDGRLNTVESYNPATDKWAEESPLLVGKSEPAVGLLGSTIVAAGGLAASGVTGDNEGYSASKNSWSALTDDPTPRQATCAASVSGRLYSAGGTNGAPLNIAESFNVSTNKWATLLPLPHAVVGTGSADVNGQLYCFGGSNNGGVFQGTVYNYLQIYQP
jgi:N-acetylneuraminic acid mutarotase